MNLAIARQVVRVAFEAVAREAGLEIAPTLDSHDEPTRADADRVWFITDQLQRHGRRTIVVVADVPPPVAQRLIDNFTAGTLAAIVLADEPWLLPPTLHLAARGHGIVADEVRARAARSPRLVERELTVLRLMARGRSNPQIARQLHVSPTTVKRTVTALLRAFDCTTRLELTAAAWEAGYLPDR